MLLDLEGVVFVGDEPIPGAVDAINNLRVNGIMVRFITNTTRQPLRELVEKMRSLGVAATPDEIFMPAIAARHYLAQHNLTPYLLVHPSLVEDFAQLRDGTPNAVVVGDAGENFSYASLNHAFRALKGGAEFLALACNRSFRDKDGELSLDAGPFVAALEFATGRKATVFGKPAKFFFQAALLNIGCTSDEVVMVGDDVEADVEAAMALGLRGILVRTGKYEAGDEIKIEPIPTAVVADLSEAVTWVVGQGQ
jgi:HAD superfamily hydrolase (TIGR01458 family)